jgi:hypothetical protein
MGLASTADLPSPLGVKSQPEAPASPELLLELLLLFSVAEQRSYAYKARAGGGRYMPARVAVGVVFGALDRIDLQFLGRGTAGGDSPLQTILNRARILPFRFVNPGLPPNPPEGTPLPRDWWSFARKVDDEQLVKKQAAGSKGAGLASRHSR